jgi:hypothetical protein
MNLKYSTKKWDNEMHIAADTLVEHLGNKPRSMEALEVGFASFHSSMIEILEEADAPDPVALADKAIFYAKQRMNLVN